LLHGLFPVVRAEVLRLLFTDAGKELYTRELARLSFLALRTVQDEVAKLEAANLIVSRSNGYQRFYRANSKHPLYRVLHRPSQIRDNCQAVDEKLCRAVEGRGTPLK
jgi:hypothetical protein